MSGFVSPSGYLQIESFHLEGSKPVWRYALGDALLEKRIWMKQGENTTYVQFRLLRASAVIDLNGKVLVNYRDFHKTTHASEWQMSVEPMERGLRVVAFEGATPFYLKSAAASWSAQQEWYRDYFLPEGARTRARRPRGPPVCGAVSLPAAYRRKRDHRLEHGGECIFGRRKRANCRRTTN